MAELDGVESGAPLPLGVSLSPSGINLAVFSRHAEAVSVLLYDDRAAREPSAQVRLDPRRHRTGDIWHVRIPAEFKVEAYSLQVDGPRGLLEGHRFDPIRHLVEPYAAAIDVGPPQKVGGRSGWSRVATPRAFIANQSFEWGDDLPPRHSWSETVIYESHVRGLTIHPSSEVHHPGQYLGVVEKIPYLQALGVTAIELMPVQAFDPKGVSRRNPATDEVLRDYWGYNPVALFAPAAYYAEDTSPEVQLNGFKTMVRELHKAGIEVILDVVFNHTGEGDASGPTYSFRGLDNVIYYLLAQNKRDYVDFSGCGNTLNCNHPVVRSMIIDCLRHWVVHMHVDGFRFDLASVLGRDPKGRLMPNPPLLEQIAEDPILRDVKLIAEAWDLGGAFQVGSFPGRRWAEWNCHYRDDVRRFWRGDPGMTGAFATRICGSADLYQGRGETPLNSINFVTSHDGFTLNDLVSYACKHNDANGEENRDGASENFSENNGTEGATANPVTEAVRMRQIKNMLVTLFISRGVPMLLGGDEFRRSQAGNNNAYCQDNELSWYDWSMAKTNAGLVRFVSCLAALRRAHPALRAERFYTDQEIDWFGTDGGVPEWHGRDNRLGCLVRDGSDGPDGRALCLLFNATLAS